MTLKYYREEAAKYGTLGPITEAQIQKALDAAYVKWDLPRITIKVSTTPRKYSSCKPGLGLVDMSSLKLWPAMDVPLIKMARNMMDWATFCHELAHFIHCIRFNRRAESYAIKAGVNVKSTLLRDRVNYATWAKISLNTERGHGPQHRAIMAEVVGFYKECGMIINYNV